MKIENNKNRHSEISKIYIQQQNCVHTYNKNSINNQKKKSVDLLDPRR
jgi:hypothetical protein